MKKLPAFLLTCLLLGTLYPSASAATAATTTPTGQINGQFFNQETGAYDKEMVDLVQITLNGAPVSGSVPTVIRSIDGQGRTLAPARLVAEALGATARWDNAKGQATITRDDKTILLTIGSAIALVDGVETPLPDGVPACILYYLGDRTMVPVRFIAEQLGAEVSWDQATYTAALTYAGNSAAPRVTSVSANSGGGKVRISTLGAPAYRVQDFGDRAVIDILGATIASGGELTVNNALFSSVRYSQHGSDLDSNYSTSVRVVVDLNEGVSTTQNMALTQDAAGIVIAFSGSADGTPAPTYNFTTPIDPGSKTIVLDPGHGGIYSGATHEGIMEKDINLSVALKLRDTLKGLGYNVIMTMEDDLLVGLYGRCRIANAAKADIFISLHSNAIDNRPTVNGIITYYYPGSETGKKLAQTIQTPLCEVTGAKDRGLGSENFVVVRETTMPAVLVEMGFTTNYDELMRMADSHYQFKLAQGIAEGAIRYLNGT